MPLGLVVKGVEADPHHINLTARTNDPSKRRRNHWFVITGFERAVDGSVGVAEKSGVIKPGDIVAGVNRTTFLDKDFHGCRQSMRIAEWPLTLHILSNPDRVPSAVEGWVVRVLENGRHLMSAKDEVRLRWQNQHPDTDTYRCYLTLRLDGELLLTRPVDGGGMAHQPERVWSIHQASEVRKVCEESKGSTSVLPRWCVAVSFGAGAVRGSIRIQLPGMTEMHIWGDALEKITRKHRLSSSREADKRMDWERGDVVSSLSNGLLKDVEYTIVPSADDTSDEIDALPLIAQPKSTTSSPVEVASLAGEFTLHLAFRLFCLLCLLCFVCLLSIDDLDAGHEEASSVKKLNQFTALSLDLAERLAGLQNATRCLYDTKKIQTMNHKPTFTWQIHSVIFNHREPLNLVVKGVAKADAPFRDEGFAGNTETNKHGHWIIVSGFTSKDASGSVHVPGAAESTGRIFASDVLIGINDEPLADDITFNTFARTMRTAKWPLTLNFVRDPEADTPEQEGWVARCSVNTATVNTATHTLNPNYPSSFGVHNTKSVRRYLTLRGRRLSYHKPVRGGAMAAAPEGSWDLTQVECLMGVLDMHASVGEQWIVVLKLREPISATPGNAAMTGHASFTTASQAELQTWLRKLAHYSHAERHRVDFKGKRLKGGLKQLQLHPLVVVPEIWSLPLKADEAAASIRASSGESTRVTMIRTHIDRYFFDNHAELTVLISSGRDEFGQRIVLPGSDAGELRYRPPALSKTLRVRMMSDSSSAIVSGGPLFKLRSLRKSGSKTRSADIPLNTDDHTDPQREKRERVLSIDEDEASRRRLASSLYATVRLGESRTLGDALFKYQEHRGVFLSVSDAQLLLHTVGIAELGSKMAKDETGMVEEVKNVIKM